MKKDNSKLDLRKEADQFKGMAKKFNEKALNISEEVVEDTLKAAEKWQTVAAKALKAGTVLMEKQQDVFFHTLEGVKMQSLAGFGRLKKLFNVGTEEVSGKMKTKQVSEVAKVSGNVLKEVSEKVSEVEMQAKAAFSRTAKRAAQEVAKTADFIKHKAVEVASEAYENEVEAINSLEAAHAEVKDDLKSIDGIGPKMEKVLNEAGIFSFRQLANADADNMKEMLVKINKRYAMYHPAEWIAAAQSRL